MIISSLDQINQLIWYEYEVQFTSLNFWGQHFLIQQFSTMRQLTVLGLQQNDQDPKTKKRRMFINRIHHFNAEELRQLHFSEKQIRERIKKQDKMLDEFCDVNKTGVIISDMEPKKCPQLGPYEKTQRPIANSALQIKMRPKFMDFIQVARVNIDQQYQGGHSKKLRDITFTEMISDTRMMTPKKLRENIDKGFVNGLIQNIDNLISKFSRKELFKGEHQYLKKRVKEIEDCAPQIMRNAKKGQKDVVAIKINRLIGMVN